MGNERPVNLLRATTTCNTFYIFLSAAKASLLPFLTLFFRLIGLSAMDTGIIMAAKTLTGFIWAPLWARCAVAYNKRRLVLVFSLLMMGVMYLSFIAVYHKVANPRMCEIMTNVGQQDDNTTQIFLVGTVDSPKSGNSGEENVIDSSSLPVHHSDGGPEAPTLAADLKSSTSASVIVQNASPKLPVEEKGEQLEALSLPVLNRSHLETAQPSLSESFESISELLNNISNRDISDEDINQAGVQIINVVNDNVDKSQLHLKRSSDRHIRNLNFTFFNDLKNKVNVLTATLKEKDLLLFFMILLIIIFGEFFSSPVEKIADDAWFDFLERIDDMEKYGRQRYWGSLTFALVPIVVAVVVDHTPCQMMFSIHHFLMHFYIFGIFIIFTLFVAFYFPMPPPAKQKYSSKVGKGLRVICCDGRGFLFVITLLVAGMVFASFNNFLFWHLQDLGGTEVVMGLCVAIGAFSETPMLVFSNMLVKKLGNGRVVSLCMLALALRVLYYGFVKNPWAVLPAELTNAFTHTALWYAVLSYEEFNVGSALDRSIRSILSSLYFGLGFSAGSFVSGVVYNVYGASILFWGASVLSGTWCLLYSVTQFCLPKKERVKYIKLLRKDEDESSEGDDDWLEMALKDQ